MTHKSSAITMSLIRIGVLAAQITVSPSAAAQSTPAVGSQRSALMEGEKEIALALSACPPFVAGNDYFVHHGRGSWEYMAGMGCG